MSTQIDKVLAYYRATYHDYQYLWTRSEDLAIHFGYFDAQATTHRASLLRINAVLAAHAGITAADHVLDAGCGYGGSALWLAKHVGCSVTGINPVPFQVEKATQAARRRQLADRVAFQLGDYARTPFAAGSFAVFWGLESVVHAEDKPAVLREAFRLLRPGGRIVLAEYTLRDKPPLSAQESQALEPWLTGWAMPSLLTVGQYRRFLENAGFSAIEVHDVSRQVAPSLRRLKRLCRIGLPLARIMHRLRLFTDERWGNVEGSWRQIKGFEREQWRYTILVARKEHESSVER